MVASPASKLTSVGVAMTVHTRPQYAVEAVKALAAAIAENPYVADFLLLAIDGDPHPMMYDTCDKMGEMLAENLGIDVEIQSRETRVGLSGNVGMSIDSIFEKGYKYALHLEDDAVLTKGAMDLISHFIEKYEEPGCRVACLSLSAHELQINDKSRVANNCQFLGESQFITSPFALLIPADEWYSWAKPFWDFKQSHPRGWDYSFSMALNLFRKKCNMFPLISRCLNIGREGGAHETPETFDRTQVGVVSTNDLQGPALWPLATITCVAQDGAWMEGEQAYAKVVSEIMGLPPRKDAGLC